MNENDLSINYGKLQNALGYHYQNPKGALKNVGGKIEFTYATALSEMQRVVIDLKEKYDNKPAQGKDYERWEAVQEILRGAYGKAVASYDMALTKINQLQKDLPLQGLDQALGSALILTHTEQCIDPEDIN